MPNYDGMVRVKDYVYDPVPDIPRKIIGYRVVVVSPAHRKGETFDLQLRSDESMNQPDYGVGEEFRCKLP